MSPHPLIDLANDADAKQVKTFREVTQGLTGSAIAEMLRAETEGAAEDSGGEITHFADHDGTVEGDVEPTEAQLAIAIYNQCKLDETMLKLPAADLELDVIDYHVSLTALPKRKIKARMRPVTSIDLFGLTVEERMVVINNDLMLPKSTKGDTPLRALAEGLAVVATAQAHRASLVAQTAERFGRTPNDEPPILIVLANSRYWEMYRKRSLKSAGPWMAEMKRLVAEIEEATEVSVFFGSLKLYGDPGWRIKQGKPVIEAEPRLLPGLDPVGRELRPKSKTRAVAVEEVVEADPSREPRGYSVRELYEPGDTIRHPTLGSGVVQKLLGPTKVEVRFGETPRVLVHGRG